MLKANEMKEIADLAATEKHCDRRMLAFKEIEKLVEYNAAKLVIIADASKKVSSLGTKFPLPVEVVEEARVPVTKELEKLGAKVTLREGVKKAGPVITDNGNLILDCLWENPVNPAFMENTINALVGVVENGFFTKKKPTVFVVNSTGTVEIF